VKKVANALFQTASSEIDWTAVENESARLLSQYIQIDTTNPPGNEATAAEFLADILRDRGFEPHVVEAAPGRANLVTRWPAHDKTRASPCMLYTHTDVVPADSAGWTVPPFQGKIEADFVWGRGALDNKGLGIIFLQALYLLMQSGLPLKRDVIFLAAADEEVTGRYGVAWLFDHHPDLIRAEYVWDEGGVGLKQPGAGEDYLYEIAVAEKSTLAVKLVAHGTPGHASIPHRDNSQDRLVRALTRIKRWKQPARLTDTVIEMLQTLAARQRFPRSTLFANAHRAWLWPLLRAMLETDPFFAPLIGNTISLTMLRGGQSSNVIPAQAEAGLDIRLLPGENSKNVLTALRSVVADPKVAIEAEELPVVHPPTPTGTDFFRALEQTLRTIGPPGLALPIMTPGTTDSRFFRRAGMKAYGFLPMLLDARELSRIHGIDERVSTANLRWGTQVVFETLRKLCC